ncbi:hypothetical protein GGI35DRAFT_199704 [Trichoderma velutinum]
MPSLSRTARGCHPDEVPEFPTLRRMVGNKGGGSSLDIAGCEESCWRASFNDTVLYAGIKAGNQCWCSSIIGGEPTSDHDKCDEPCSSDQNDICDGERHINAFEPVTTMETSSASSTRISHSKTTAQVSPPATGTVIDSGANRLPFIDLDYSFSISSSCRARIVSAQQRKHGNYR